MQLSTQPALTLRPQLARKVMPAAWVLAGAAALGIAACGNDCAPTAPGTVHSLYITSQPTDVDAGAPLTPPVQVVALDAYSNPVSCFTGSVTVAIAGRPTGGTIAGTTTVSAIGGVATFSDLSVDSVGLGYELTATAEGRWTSSTDFEVVSCPRDCWIGRPPLPTARANLGVGVVNGLLYAVGGFAGPLLYNTVDAYDPVTGRWTARASMPTARSEFGLGVVNGILYAVGGWTDAYPQNNTASVEAYDPGTNRWTIKTALPAPRSNLGVGVVNGILYAVGGRDSAGHELATVEAYNPATNQWTTKAPMPTPRFSLGVAVVNGILYAVGGAPTDGSPAPVEAYDPATDHWTTKAPMPTVAHNIGVGVIDGVLYAVGSARPPYSIVAYDPRTDSWTPKTPIPRPDDRKAVGVGVVNGVLYAIGGYSQWAGAFLSSNTAYRP